MAEALLVDQTRFKDSLVRHGGDLTSKKARFEAAAILNSATGMHKLQHLFLDGKALQPVFKD